MTNLLHVNDGLDIPKIVELIHDRWLDADSITFDSQASILNIRYLKEIGSASSLVGRIRFPAFECFLRILNVKSYSVQDKQKVRFYDMNALTYDPTSMCVHLRTGVPIEIRVIVTALGLTVEETGAVVQG